MTRNRDENESGKIFVRVDPDLADLIPGFLDNRRKDIAAMQEALKHGDFETVRVLGHSMKGAGGGYGFDAITDIGAALEEAARDNNPGKVLRGVSNLAAYLDRVEVIHD
jgi:HPt (histidine-containing phosphotransfer) domain-containing protein